MVNIENIKDVIGIGITVAFTFATMIAVLVITIWAIFKILAIN